MCVCVFVSFASKYYVLCVSLQEIMPAICKMWWCRCAAAGADQINLAAQIKLCLFVCVYLYTLRTDRMYRISLDVLMKS